MAGLSRLRPSRSGWRRGGKRASERWECDYLPWALADFSGYLSMDELYDGPFCILSIVDNRSYKRLFYQVLEHDPKHDDMLAFLQRFQVVLQARQLTVLGITTDGSPLYPAALAAVFPRVAHQICEFHILKELNQASLRAVAQQPKLGRGRPSGAR